MYSEATCGILTGGVFALGLIFAEDKPTTNEKVKGITNEWLNIFEEKFGSLNCKKLKEEQCDSNLGCGPLIVKAAELLEKLINKYK